MEMFLDLIKQGREGR